MNSFDLILRCNFADVSDHGKRVARVRVQLCGLGLAAADSAEDVLHSSATQGASAPAFGCAHLDELALNRFNLKPLTSQLNWLLRLLLILLLSNVQFIV